MNEAIQEAFSPSKKSVIKKGRAFPVSGAWSSVGVPGRNVSFRDFLFHPRQLLCLMAPGSSREKLLWESQTCVSVFAARAPCCGSAGLPRDSALCGSPAGWGVTPGDSLGHLSLSNAQADDLIVMTHSQQLWNPCHISNLNYIFLSGKIVSCLLGHLHLTRTHLTLVCLQSWSICQGGRGMCPPLLPFPMRAVPVWGLVLEGSVLGHAWGPICAGFLSSAETRAWGLGLLMTSSADSPGGGGMGPGGKDGGQCGWGKQAWNDKLSESLSVCSSWRESRRGWWHCLMQQARNQPWDGINSLSGVAHPPWVQAWRSGRGRRFTGLGGRRAEGLEVGFAVHPWMGARAVHWCSHCRHHECLQKWSHPLLIAIPGGRHYYSSQFVDDDSEAQRG